MCATVTPSGKRLICWSVVLVLVRVSIQEINRSPFVCEASPTSARSRLGVKLLSCLQTTKTQRWTHTDRSQVLYVCVCVCVCVCKTHLGKSWLSINPSFAPFSTRHIALHLRCVQRENVSHQFSVIFRLNGMFRLRVLQRPLRSVWCPLVRVCVCVCVIICQWHHAAFSFGYFHLSMRKKNQNTFFSSQHDRAQTHLRRDSQNRK